MEIPFSRHAYLLKEYMSPYGRKVLLVVLLIFLNVGLQIYNPQIIRNYLDSVANLASIEVLSRAALMFIVIAIIQEVIYMANVYFSTDLAWAATNDLRFSLMRHCVSLDMTFHNQYKPGQMIERVDGDVNALSNFFSAFALLIFSNILLLGGVLVTLLLENLVIGLAFTGISLIALTSMWYVRKISVSQWKEARETTSQLMGFIEERLAGTEEIRANDGIENVYKNFHSLSKNEYNGYNNAVFKSRISMVLTFSLMALGTTMTYVLGIPMVYNNDITPGTLYLYTYYFQLILNPIFEILRQIQNLQQADASIDRINELFDIKTKLLDTGTQSMEKGVYDIKFKELNFAYHEDDYVLRDINFHLHKGKSMGLIGKTGSGKTTLSRLIYRLYDHKEGTIQINGVDIRDLSLKELRKMIVIVTQQVQLFAATIKENVTFFDESIPDEKVLQTIEMVGLKEWLDEQPNGLNTKLKKAGLSAGQEQLLAFARAFITDPSIVILDEASSRLDPATEILIDRAVSHLLENRTAIIIAHRLETLEHVDDILILENGEIIEYGERSKLISDENSCYSYLRSVGIEELLA